MAGIAKQALVVSLSRFANYGLLLLSPVVLVRLLSVGDFGRYREFLVYSTLLLSFAAFNIPNSLLYFVPGDPKRTWQYVRQAVQLVAIASAVVVTCTVAADWVSGGRVIGQHLLPLSIYVLLYANLDFWEYLWLATRQPIGVFAYTSGRLIARMSVVIAMAYFFHSIDAVIWGLVVLEGVRLGASAIAWVIAGKHTTPTQPGDWSRMLHFCLPAGGSNLLGMLNRYAANIFVAKAMGPAALAHYTIGTYVEPIIITLRNSLSDALLPAMVNRGVSSRDEAVLLWQRGTVMAAILLLPIGVLIERFAHTLIVTVFSSSYESAVPVMRIFLIVLIRECFDFPMALRAINKTRYFLYGDVAAIVVNLALLIVLVPRWGLIGVTGAYVISSWLQGAYLGWCTTHLYETSARHFIPWRELSKVAIAAAIPLILTYGDFLTDRFKLLGVVLASAVYLPVYALLLWLLRVREAHVIFERVRERLVGGSPALKT